MHLENCRHVSLVGQQREGCRPWGQQGWSCIVLLGNNVRVDRENGHTHQLKKQKKGSKIYIVYTMTFLHNSKVFHAVAFNLLSCCSQALHVIISGNCNEQGDFRFETEPAKQEAYEGKRILFWS